VADVSDVLYLLYCIISTIDGYIPINILSYVNVVKVGANGTGKTTLLKILLGDLRPVRGVHHVHRSLRFGYFSQHHVDQLDMNVSSVQVLEAKFPGLYALLLRT